MKRPNNQTEICPNISSTPATISIRSIITCVFILPRLSMDNRLSVCLFILYVISLIRWIRWIRVRFILIREIRSPLKLTEYHILVDSHQFKSKETAAQVLEGSSEVVEAVVDDEEAVMETAVVLPQFYPAAILLLV